MKFVGGCQNCVILPQEQLSEIFGIIKILFGKNKKLGSLILVGTERVNASFFSLEITGFGTLKLRCDGSV
jgi:hypothetical protein